jgi:hypothetical protein
MEERAEFEIADEEFLAGGEGEAEVEASEGGDGFEFSCGRDAIDLALLASGPEGAVRIESKAFGVVQTFGEDLKLVDRNERLHFRISFKKFVLDTC